MKKIVTKLMPFIFSQTIYIYDDNGNVIGASITTIDQFPDKIIELSEKFKINQIDIAGPIMFTKGIVKKINKKEIEKYSEKKLIFNYI